MRREIRNLICLFLLTVFGLSGCQFIGQLSSDLIGIVVSRAEITEPNIVEIPEAELAPLEDRSEAVPAPPGESLLTGSAEPNIVAIPEAVLTAPKILEVIHKLIYQGEFDTAGELIKYRQFQLGRLAKIVREYQAINQQRRSARQLAYSEQLTKLERFRADAVEDPIRLSVEDSFLQGEAVCDLQGGAFPLPRFC